MTIRGTKLGFETDDARWRAVESREPAADGAFVFGVRTTGIFCRPGCRSRRPNRANVRFFEDVPSAERAGFRACKRCQPVGPRAEDLASSAIARVCGLIERSDSFPGRAALAAEAGLSAVSLDRLFKKGVGLTLRAYAMSIRAERFRWGLEAGKTVAGSILGAGFGSIGRGYEASGEALGMTPGEYRRGAEGLAIRYATARSTLGWVLVAATERGLCSIALGDTPEGLILGLVERFPRAELAKDDADFEAQLQKVVGLVEAARVAFDLPLDIRGTAFQRQVWEALRAIPRGTTATYSDVARSIGRPSSVRAVANACASNELAIVIPCHRVVRGDGGLGGYRWGVERKRKLLEDEAGRGE